MDVRELLEYSEDLFQEKDDVELLSWQESAEGAGGEFEGCSTSADKGRI